jgi:hypothetical protein
VLTGVATFTPLNSKTTDTTLDGEWNMEGTVRLNVVGDPEIDVITAVTP